MVTFTAAEQYAQVTVAYMVDNVCLQDAKVREIRGRFAEQARVLRESGGADAEQLVKLEQEMNEAESAVPLVAVPKPKSRRKTEEQEADKGASAQAKQANDRDEPPAGLVNELGVPSGKFGWCVACRATANLYCKHTRHPVCSFECKQRHIRLLEEAAAPRDSTAASAAAG